MLVEHQKTSESLKATTADNKVLISQHQYAAQRNQKQLEVKLAEEDKILESTRQAMSKEVEREKQKTKTLEEEK